jgi:hypothetical protein
MATESASMGGDPQQLLSRSRELADRVRKAQRVTWVPLAVLAAATFGAVPAYRFSHSVRTCRTWVHPQGQSGTICLVYNSAAFVYWPIALVAAYVTIAALYLRRSRAHGVGTRVRPYVIAGIAIAVLLTGTSLWVDRHPPIDPHDILGLHIAALQAGSIFRLTGPASAIGLALLVLAWAERSRALLAFAFGYLTIVLIPIDFGWVIARPSRWSFLPHFVIDGGVLLLGAIAFALAQRAARQSSA